ncbi:MAG: hypothetical protein M0T71_12825 [Actinomycetota bacterium]|nr:hypothetical protein [Actinomycetota bacterium]
MLGLVDSLARRVAPRALRRGLAEGNTTWLALGAAAFVLRWLVRPEQAKVSSEDLRVGEALLVRHLPPPPTRRQRRRAERAAGRQVLARQAADEAARAIPELPPTGA